MAPELEKFKSDGILVVKALLDSETIASARRSIARTFSVQLHNMQEFSDDDAFSAMHALYQQDLDRYKKTASALWRKLAVYQLMHDPRIIGFLHEKFSWNDIFVSGGQVVHIMARELKIPGGYFGLVAHQDFPSVQGSLDGVVVWLPLVDIGLSNFPLEVIVGSHKRGLLPMVDYGNAQWEIRRDLYCEDDFLPVAVDIGDVVFMSMFTIHRTSGNGIPGCFRLAASTRFDNAEEPTFIERCYPSAYQRIVHRDQHSPDFPSEEQIEAAFQVTEPE